AAHLPMAFSETTTRVLVAAVGVPVAVLVVYAGGWVLAGLIAVLAVLATLEFYRLAEAKGARPLRGLGAAIAAAFAVLAAFAPEAGPDEAGFATLIVVAVLLAA